MRSKIEGNYAKFQDLTNGKLKMDCKTASPHINDKTLENGLAAQRKWESFCTWVGKLPHYILVLWKGELQGHSNFHSLADGT